MDEVRRVRGLFGGGADCRGDDDAKVNFDVWPGTRFDRFGSWMGLTRADSGGGNLTLGVCGPPMKEGGFLLRVSGCGGRGDWGPGFIKMLSRLGRRGGSGGGGRFNLLFGGASPWLGRLYSLEVFLCVSLLFTTEQSVVLEPDSACSAFDLLRKRNDVNRLDRLKDPDLLRRSFLADVRLRENMETMEGILCQG